MVVCPVGRKRQEGTVVNELAAGQAQFAQGLALGNEGGNGLVANLGALVKVDLEDVGTVLSKGQNRIVLQLGAFVKFKLREKPGQRNSTAYASQNHEGVSQHRLRLRMGRQRTLLINLQLSASWIMLSLVIKRQPEMFRPWSLVQ